jgi:hypothetical protein
VEGSTEHTGGGLDDGITAVEGVAGSTEDVGGATEDGAIVFDGTTAVESSMDGSMIEVPLGKIPESTGCCSMIQSGAST